MSNVGQVAVLVAFPILAGAVGSGVAAVRQPGPRLVSAIQHFVTGVVIAALAGEMLPDLRHEGNLGWAVAGFTAGLALVLSLATYGRHLDAKPTTASEVDAPATDGWYSLVPIGFLVTVAIDLLIDGVLIGLGVRLGSTQGLILPIALTLVLLFLTLSLNADLTDRSLTSKQASAICIGLSLSISVGAISAAVLLGGGGAAVLAFVLAFGAVALLHLGSPGVARVARWSRRRAARRTRRAPDRSRSASGSQREVQRPRGVRT